jgi:glycosyltransferase involved in cell wall biosynthesis
MKDISVEPPAVGPRLEEPDEHALSWSAHGAPGAPSVSINGRFLVQPQSGVQRFALETTRALLRRAERLGTRLPSVLLPRSDAQAVPNDLNARVVGRHTGQIWEQLDLKRAAHGSVLINLANTASLRLRRQIVVIHDAGVFRRPDTYDPKFRLWYKILHPLLVRRGATVVTVSDFSRQEIAACLHCPLGRISLVSESGDHMHRLVPDRSILARAGLEEDGYVLAVGNLAAHKNLAALGQTARMLAAHGLTLAIIGGLDSDVFERTKSNLPQPATYVGRVTDAELAALYASARCFVFPSTYEGFGIPALEAMGLGCAVVAARIPALQEVCADAAAFCDPQDPADIAAAVERVACNPDHRRSLQARGYARAALFSWDKTADQLAAIIDRQFRPGGTDGAAETPSAK